MGRMVPTARITVEHLGTYFYSQRGQKLGRLVPGTALRGATTRHIE